MGRSKTIHHILRSRASKRSGFRVRFEEVLLAEERLIVSLPFDPPRPVVADTDVYLGPYKQQLAHIKFADMI